MHIQATLEHEWEAYLTPVPHRADRVFKAKVLSAFLRRKRADAERLLEQRRKDIEREASSISSGSENRQGALVTKSQKRRARLK